MLKEIGKTHMVKAALFCRLGESGHAFYKYHQAFQCFLMCFSYYSNPELGAGKKKISKECDLLLISLTGMARLYYESGSLSRGSETLGLVLSIIRLVYKPHHEWNKYIANMVMFYEPKVVCVII